MKDRLDSDPRVGRLAQRAIEMEGMTPVIKPIRGGTDGSRLSYEGILTPNLFTGGGDFHSRKEWVCVDWMEKSVRVILNLCALWAQER
jgi:tripeptide aminopeptidase